MHEDTPARVAIANDYELVVAGVTSLLLRYPQHVEVCDAIVVGQPVAAPVHVALYDTYGRAGSAASALRALHADPNVERVALFSLDLRPPLIEEAQSAGVDAFISKALPGEEIARSLQRAAAGDRVRATSRSTRVHEPALIWPGRAEGLTERESQVLVLCAEGMTNAEIGRALFIGTETVKTHLANALRRLGLRNRTQGAAFVERSGASGFRRHGHLDDVAKLVQAGDAVGRRP